MPPRTTTLSQVIAVEKAARQAAKKSTALLLQDVKKPQLVAGFTQMFKPDVQPVGEGTSAIVQPDKGTRLQLVTEDSIAELARVLIPAIDITAAKDWANCDAKASIMIGDVTIVPDVPVSHLLWLEHQLTEVLMFFKNCQTLDPAEYWEPVDGEPGKFRSRAEHRIATEQHMESLVLIEPTQHQPGQAQPISVQARIGMWEITKYSGALKPERKRELGERAEALLGAVRQARERANQGAAPVQDVGRHVFAYLLGHGPGVRR